jgi:tape measure domain-containing protein
MGEDGKVIYKVVIDDNGVESESEAAGRKAGDGVEKGASRGAGAFKQMMIGAAREIGAAFVRMAQEAVKGVEQIAKAGIEFNAKMEQYQTGLTTLLGSEKEAAAVMEQIRKDAARTPFDVDSLTQANQMLISTGMSADKARDDVLNLANAIAATGGGSAELSRMASNMQQIKNVGKATAMDIRQFAMAGINIYQLLADATGKTTEQVKDMEVSYDLLSKALAKAAEEGGAYYGAMEAQAETFNGRLSTLKDNAIQLAGTLTQDLFAKLSNEGLPMVANWVGELLQAAQENGIKGAIEAAHGILSSLWDAFMDGLPQMIDAGLKTLTGFLNGIADNLPKVNETVLQIIMVILDAIIANLPDIIAAGLRVLSAFINGLIQAMPQIIPAVIQIMTALVEGLLDYIPELVQLGMKLLAAIAVGIIQALPQLWEAIKRIASDIFTLWGWIDWASIGRNLVQGIWNGIVSLWNELVTRVRNSINNLVREIQNALGIHSPSTVFAYIGKMSVEGMEEGFEDGEKDLNATVKHLYSGMIQAASVTGNGDLERAVSNNISISGTAGAATIVVPLSIDGREVARATAWNMGEQLAWEEM